MASNGWRTGRDPFQRALRIIATVTMLGVFTVIVLDTNRGADDLPYAAIALGALLLLLGYEGIVRIPGLMNGKKEDE